MFIKFYYNTISMSKYELVQICDLEQSLSSFYNVKHLKAEKLSL